MRFPGFIGPSYTLQSVNVDCQRCVNLYPEVNELGTGKEGEIAALVGTPGLRLLCALPTGPVRGTYATSDGQLFAVGGNVLYKISALWVASAIGTLGTSSGPVSFSDNGLQCVVVDGPYGYSFTIASPSGTFAQITDEYFLGATQVDFMDGYLIFAKPESKNFFISGINALTFDGLDIGTAEAGPDNLVGLICTQENLILLGTQTIEVYYDSGNDFPFQRVQGAVAEIGCQAAFSIAKIGNAVYFLGQDKNGAGIVYRGQGLQTQRISTFAVEQVIKGLGDVSGARAWVYQQAGHAFYCLNLPGASTTWVYDTSTSLWHERAYLSQGQYQRHPADCHAFAYNTNVVGDYSNGNIYALDPEVFTDNGNPLVRERIAPHISKEDKFITHSRFQLDIETGVGINGSGQGASPQAMLQWSNNYGKRWSNEHWASIGAIGEDKTGVVWRRLGMSKNRVYRVKISDPVKVTMLGADIELEQGAS